MFLYLRVQYTSDPGRLRRDVEGNSVPASVWKRVECACVGPILQLAPAFDVDGGGTSEAAKGVAVAISGVGGNASIAGELPIDVLFAIAGCFVHNGVGMGIGVMGRGSWYGNGHAQARQEQ